jgi:hypothetical protein
MGISKNKLFPSNEQSDGGPSKKDDQKDYELFDQFGVHETSFSSKAGESLYFSLKYEKISI